MLRQPGRSTRRALCKAPSTRNAWPATALLLALTGCAGESDPPAPTGNHIEAAESSGFSLPPGFKVVDLPAETRKAIFREAHNIRALAVQEANHILPMDEASLPKKDKVAFDKRVADHKAIIVGIEAKKLGELAATHKITIQDVEKIEEEANRLRWIPPQDPVFEPTTRAKPTDGPGPDGK